MYKIQNKIDNYIMYDAYSIVGISFKGKFKVFIIKDRSGKDTMSLVKRTEEALQPLLKLDPDSVKTIMENISLLILNETKTIRLIELDEKSYALTFGENCAMYSTLLQQILRINDNTQHFFKILTEIAEDLTTQQVQMLL